MDLHLQPADAKRAEHRDAVAVGAVVAHVDPFDARGRHRVDVGGGAKPLAAGPRAAGHQLHTCRTRHSAAALRRRAPAAACEASGIVTARTRPPKRCDQPVDERRLNGSPRRHGDVCARAREESRGPCADRAGAGRDDRALSRQRRRRPAAAWRRPRRRWCSIHSNRASPTRASVRRTPSARPRAAVRPRDMSVPPMKIAVLRRSFGPRVKMQPWTRSRTVSAATPP